MYSPPASPQPPTVTVDITFRDSSMCVRISGNCQENLPANHPGVNVCSHGSIRGDMIIRIHSLPTAGNCSGASRLRSFRLSAGSLAISGTAKLFLKGMHFFSAKKRVFGCQNPKKTWIFEQKHWENALLETESRTHVFLELHTAFWPQGRVL